MSRADYIQHCNRQIAKAQDGLIWYDGLKETLKKSDAGISYKEHTKKVIAVYLRNRNRMMGESL